MPTERPSPLAATLPVARDSGGSGPAFANTVPLASSTTLPGADGSIAPLARGATVGRYVVIDRIGEGGMGFVYRAYDPELDRRIALKLLRAGAQDASVGTSEGRARLVREGQAMARLQHPNVVAVHDVGTYAGQVFIGMELVDGGTLRAWLDRDRHRPWREVVAMFAQAGRGLAAAHDAGIVHRDFKADNVLVGKDGRPRVVDFGLAHAPNDGAPRESRIEPTRSSASPSSFETPLTAHGALIGTPRYMSPEQLTGERTDASADQFSFCVALYEALYGEVPFAGDDLVTLAANVRAGRVREARATGRGVPGWLRAAVLRGLAVSARDRYPSMRELLAAIERDPAVARRRWAIGVGAVVAAASVALAARDLHARRAPVCPSAEPELAGAWDDAKRSATLAAFRATGMPYADDAHRGAARALDAYAAAWTAMHHEACEATLVRAEQSSELMDLRMECLRDRLDGLRATTDLFARADATTVERAVQAAGALAPLDACADAAGLRAPTREPGDPAVRSKIEAVRRAIAEARANEEAGRPTAGLPIADEAVADARAIGYRPLEAEALDAQGRLLDVTGDAKRGAEALRDAVAASIAGRHESFEPRAWIDLLASYLIQARLDEARAAAQDARASLERQGGDDALTATLLAREGVLAFRQGRYDEAREREDRAIAIGERIGNRLEVAASSSELGNALHAQGKYDDALVAHRRALAIREAALGGAHPLVAASLNNVANALYAKGDLDEALAMYRRAYAIKAAALGEGHASTANTLQNIGVILMHQGKYDEALDDERRALATREKALGPDHPDIADTLGNVAAVLLRMERWDDALATGERERAIYARAYGDDHEFLAWPLTDLGLAWLGKGDAARALPPLAKAVRLGEAHAIEPVQLALARFGLARALWGTHSDAARARSLATLARDAFAAAGAPRAMELAECDAALAAHR